MSAQTNMTSVALYLRAQATAFTEGDAAQVVDRDDGCQCLLAIRHGIRDESCHERVREARPVVQSASLIFDCDCQHVESNCENVGRAALPEQKLPMMSHAAHQPVAFKSK